MTLLLVPCELCGRPALSQIEGRDYCEKCLPKKQSEVMRRAARIDKGEICPRCGRGPTRLLNPCGICGEAHCSVCYCGEGEDTSPYGRDWPRDLMA